MSKKWLKRMNVAHTKKMKYLLFAFWGLYAPLFCMGQTLHSINIQGNRLQADNSTGLYRTADAWVAMGTSTQLSIQFFDFNKGATSELVFRSSNGDLISASLQGAGGVMENDSTFIVLGQMEFPDDLSHLVLIKARKSGTVVWARRFVHPGLDIADKIMLLANGDYLLSMHQDKREDQFGGLISGSALFRFSPNGSLLWSYQIDDSPDKNAGLRSVNELPSGRLLLTVRKNKKLQLIALNPAGQFLHSILSNEDILPTASFYNPISNRLFVQGENKHLLVFDSLFQLQSAYSFTHNDLQRFSGMISLNDSMMALSGVYKNEAFVARISQNQLGFNSVFHHNFFPFTSSLVQGMFVVRDTFYSLISNGFAVNRHAADLSHPCFSTANGNTIQRVNTSFSFTTASASQSLDGSWVNENSIIVDNLSILSPSVNCNPYDLSVRMPLLRYTNSCRNVDLRFYVFNNGTLPVSRFTLRFYYKDSMQEKRIEIPAIASKTGVFVDFGSLYLDQGESRVFYAVSLPNDQADGFPYDDSLYADFVTTAPVNIGISATSPICENENNVVRANGPEGLYSLERDGAIILQSTQQQFNITGGGQFRFQFENNQGCKYFSTLLDVETWPAPPLPGIFITQNGLQTDASAPNFWYYNQVLVDSNKTEIDYKGPGTYSVEALTDKGCRTRAERSNVIIGTQRPLAEAPQAFVSENTLFWPHEQKATLHLLSIEGKTMYQFNTHSSGSWLLTLPTGFYLLEVKNTNGTHYQKLRID